MYLALSFHVFCPTNWIQPEVIVSNVAADLTRTISVNFSTAIRKLYFLIILYAGCGFLYFMLRARFEDFERYRKFEDSWKMDV